MAEKTENEMSFLEHLEVLRWHIIRALLGILIIAIVAFVFKDIVFNKIILAPKLPEFVTNRLLCDFGRTINILTLCINSRPFEVISIKMAGQFSMHIMVSLIAGFVVSFPYVFWEGGSSSPPCIPRKKDMPAGLFFTVLCYSCSVLPSATLSSFPFPFISWDPTV
jgi:sec-independent protein translocase protein TatC